MGMFRTLSLAVHCKHYSVKFVQCGDENLAVEFKHSYTTLLVGLTAMCFVFDDAFGFGYIITISIGDFSI